MTVHRCAFHGAVISFPPSFEAVFVPFQAGESAEAARQRKEKQIPNLCKMPIHSLGQSA